MSRPDHALYVPYVSGAVWVVRHAHTVVARHASRREAIEDARRRAAGSMAASDEDDVIQVRVQNNDGSWHVLAHGEETEDAAEGDERD